MGFKYFGIITEEKYRSLSKIDKGNFLFENHLTQLSTPPVTLTFNKTNEKSSFEASGKIPLDNFIYKFSNSLVSNVYLFLKDYIIGAVKANMIVFYRDFDNDTYGFSKKKKRKEALRRFGELFYQVVSNDEVGLEINSKNEKGAEKRVKSLKRKQKELIFRLKKEKELVENYIFGNTEYYTRELLDTHPLLIDVFFFENTLAILIDLNKKFKFEIDDVFTPKTKAQLIYEEYPDEFQSLKQLEFIEKQLFGTVKPNRALVISLFDFFKNKENINTPTAELFGEIINSYFDFKFSTIKLNGSISLKHEKRLEKFKKEWEDY
jgi:hypothetical protein